MPYANQERRIVLEHMDEYLKKGEVLRADVKLDRVLRWAKGYTMAEIAKEEGTTAQAVNQTIKPVVQKILAFVEAKK